MCVCGVSVYVCAWYVYLTAYSMGAYGAWGYLQEHLDSQIAAIVPIAGNGVSAWEEAGCALARVGIWAFHGDRDGICPIERDQKVFNEMQKLGGNMKLTTWAGDNHGVSGKMVVGAANGTTEFSSDRCDKERDFMTWLFSQSR